MKIIGQPESYSDMLARIFVCDVVVGFLCMQFLGASSTRIKTLLDSWSIPFDLWGIKGVPTLYLAIPLGIGVLFRMLMLHDRISDVLRIRWRFDTKHILLPLAQKVGGDWDADAIRRDRIKLMYKVFYRYAGYKEPIIDSQLVRSALDNWGWFWVEVECLFLVIATILVVVIVGAISRIPGPIGWGLIFVGLAICHHEKCVRCASAEVDAILENKKRKDEIRRQLCILATRH